MNELQRTPDWYAARKGKLTSSSFGQAAGLGPGSRQQLWRRHFGLEAEPDDDAYMLAYGREHEPLAAESYRSFTAASASVTLAGFVVHPSLPWLGASPDLLVGPRGLGEIKCPPGQKLYPEIPPYYMAQVQGQLQVTDRDWCDFICWTPTAMRIWTVERSNAYWDWLHLLLADYWTWVQAKIEPPRAARGEGKPQDAPLVVTSDPITINLH